jgi:hypothetical protein
MGRPVEPERGIRAVAAVHVLLGVVPTVATLGLLAFAPARSHGPSDLSAAAVPIILGAIVASGAGCATLGLLLWWYLPLARWTTLAIAALAAGTCVYTFVKYTIGFILRDFTSRAGWADTGLVHSLCGGLIEILIVAWCAVVAVSLLRPGTGAAFARELRKSTRTRPTHGRVYTSPVFVTGLLIWLLIVVAGCLL